MKEFFASLYEWFGLMPLYSKDMSDLLKGWDITCTDYIATPWYTYIGLMMLIIAISIYGLQYHLLDSPRWYKKQHWWLFASAVATLNFIIAFTISFNIINAGDFCNQLNLSISDCIGFGISNAMWGFVFFLIISTVPFFRRFSTNCRHTTFWKP